MLIYPIFKGETYEIDKKYAILANLIHLQKGIFQALKIV